MSKQIEYVVFRIGSNAANQPMCQRAAIGTVTASNPREASFAALEKFGSQCYNNQHLECRAYSRCGSEDRLTADCAQNATVEENAYWESLRPA